MLHNSCETSGSRNDRPVWCFSAALERKGDLSDKCASKKITDLWLTKATCRLFFFFFEWDNKRVRFSCLLEAGYAQRMLFSYRNCVLCPLCSVFGGPELDLLSGKSRNLTHQQRLLFSVILEREQWLHYKPSLWLVAWSMS